MLPRLQELHMWEGQQPLCVQLFGRFRVVFEDRLVRGLEALKVQELFAYLLLRRDQPNRRASLAGVLWGESDSAQANKYLRHTLWQLHSALAPCTPPGRAALVQLDGDWIQLHATGANCVDVAILERAAEQAHEIPGHALSPTVAQALKDGVAVYRGDLLDGWLHDWCLEERERLQSLYLSMLDKLMGHCEAHAEWETGVTYGARILHFDRARERTHQKLMRLHYFAGDRAGALRQYQRCIAALREELGVRPSRRTVELNEQIRADQLDGSAAHAPLERPRPVPDMKARLERLRLSLLGLAYELELTLDGDEPQSTSR